MSDINEAMERLDAAARSGLLVPWHQQDLKALLSYTKQCREALEAVRTSRGFGNLPDEVEIQVLKALSTQPGDTHE